MGTQNAQKKWTMPIQNWNLTLSQLAIFLEGRIESALELLYNLKYFVGADTEF